MLLRLRLRHVLNERWPVFAQMLLCLRMLLCLTDSDCGFRDKTAALEIEDCEGGRRRAAFCNSYPQLRNKIPRKTDQVGQQRRERTQQQRMLSGSVYVTNRKQIGLPCLHYKRLHDRWMNASNVSISVDLKGHLESA